MPEYLHADHLPNSILATMLENNGARLLALVSFTKFKMPYSCGTNLQREFLVLKARKGPNGCGYDGQGRSMVTFGTTNPGALLLGLGICVCVSTELGSLFRDKKTCNKIQSHG